MKMNRKEFKLIIENSNAFVATAPNNEKTAIIKHQLRSMRTRVSIAAILVLLIVALATAVSCFFYGQSTSTDGYEYGTVHKADSTFVYTGVVKNDVCTYTNSRGEDVSMDVSSWNYSDGQKVNVVVNTTTNEIAEMYPIDSNVNTLPFGMSFFVILQIIIVVGVLLIVYILRKVYSKCFKGKEYAGACEFISDLLVSLRNPNSLEVTALYKKKYFE